MKSETFAREVDTLEPTSACNNRQGMSLGFVGLNYAKVFDEGGILSQNVVSYCWKQEENVMIAK